MLPLSSVAQAARGISKTVAVGVLRGSAMVIIVTNKDGREHTNTSRKVSRRLASPACIAGSPRLAPEFQSPVGADEVVMTSQHLEMFFKLLRRTSVGKRSSRKALDERRIQSRRVLGVVERFFESPCGSQQRSTFDLHDSIIPSRLEHLAVESRWTKDAPYNPLVEIESVGDDQRKALEIHAVGNVANERQSISVASSSSHRRWPEPRP